MATSLLAVSWPNTMPGDSVDHVDTMIDRGRAAAQTIRSLVSQWPTDRDPIGLVCLPVLALTGSGAGRRLLQLLPSRPLIARELAVDLTAPDERLLPIFQTCSELGVYVATSAIEVHPAMPDLLFHTGFVIGPSGLVLRSPKLWSRSGPSITLLSTILDRYISVFGHDAILPVVSTSFGRIGMLVEGEIDQDDSVCTLTERNPTIICNPTLRTGEHPTASADSRLRSVALSTRAVIVSACASGEIVDDNVGGWARQPFVAGTSIWSTEGSKVAQAPSIDGATAWATINGARQLVQAGAAKTETTVQPESVRNSSWSVPGTTA